MLLVAALSCPVKATGIENVVGSGLASQNARGVADREEVTVDEG